MFKVMPNSYLRIYVPKWYPIYEHIAYRFPIVCERWENHIGLKCLQWRKNKKKYYITANGEYIRFSSKYIVHEDSTSANG